jgi:hypothetical protein
LYGEEGKTERVKETKHKGQGTKDKGRAPERQCDQKWPMWKKVSGIGCGRRDSSKHASEKNFGISGWLIFYVVICEL